MFFSRRKKYRDYEIHPDEIFIDTVNVSNLDQQQFEGVIEQRIPKRALTIIFVCIFLVLVVFGYKLFELQVLKGDHYATISEANRLNKNPIFAERGIIYDTNGVELAWNTEEPDQEYLSRAYIVDDGYGHLLGYVNYPQKDDNGYYWRVDVEGQDGLEKKYNESLQGSNGAYLFEVNALGEILSEQPISEPQDGQNLITTIDARLQSAIYRGIEKQAKEASFQGGAAAVINIHTGAIATLTSYPEYDPYTLAEGSDVPAIQKFFTDPSKPFLNRAISGLYSPGSTIKPFVALAALNEDLIDTNTIIYSTGRIEIPNRFNPSNSSVFRDWRPEGHGPTDVFHAIADSVNTFFYAISGGYGSQQGLGIDRMEDYLGAFGIAQITGIDFSVEQTGVIPTPEWKEKVFADGTWRLGDTYNTSIGQFGFQVGVLQMARSMAALANMGTLHEPYLINPTSPSKNIPMKIDTQHYAVIHEAMRQTVTEGTARLIDIPELAFAAKSGTAQVGLDNEYKHSWVVGFYPASDPEYAFALVMERAPNTESNTGSATRALRTALDELRTDHPDFFTDLSS